jgi:tape measure domain-containing protein
MAEKKATLSVEVDPSAAKKGRDDFLRMMQDMSSKVSQHLKTIQKHFNGVGDTIDSRTRGTINSSINMAIKKMDQMKKSTIDMKRSEKEWTKSTQNSAAAMDKLGLTIVNNIRHIHNHTKAVNSNSKAQSNWLTNNRYVRLAMRDITNTVTNLIKSLVKLTVAFVTIFGATTLYGIVNAGKTMEKFDATLFAITGSEQEASKELKSLVDASKLYGVELTALGNSFIKLKAAANDTALGVEGAETIFTAMNIAGRALNLTSEEIRGSLYALQQMVSKSTVSMEELRLQLGERLPGALQIAADSMDLTVDKFKDLVESGKLSSDVFLSLFSSTLIRKFFDGAVRGANTLEAKIGRLKATMVELMAQMADEGIFDAFKRGIDTVINFIDEQRSTMLTVAREFGNLFNNAVTSFQTIDAETIRAVILKIAKALMYLANIAAEVGKSLAWLLDVDEAGIAENMRKIEALMTTSSVIDPLPQGATQEMFDKYKEQLDAKKIELKSSIAGINEEINSMSLGSMSESAFNSAGPFGFVPVPEIDETKINDLKLAREKMQIELDLLKQMYINANNEMSGLANTQEDALIRNSAVLRDRISESEARMKTTREDMEGIKNIGKSLGASMKALNEATTGASEAKLELDAGPSASALDENEALSKLLANLENQRLAYINVVKYQEKVTNAVEQFKAQLEKANEVAETHTKTVSVLFSEEDKLARQLTLLKSKLVDVNEAARQLSRKGINPNSVVEYKQAIDSLNLALKTVQAEFDEAHKIAQKFRDLIGGDEDYFKEIIDFAKDADKSLTGPITGVVRQLKLIDDALTIGAISSATHVSAFTNTMAELVGPASLLEKEIDALDKLFAGGSVNLQQYNKLLNELKITMLSNETDASVGITRAMARINVETKDFASQMENAIIGAFDTMTDALHTFISTGTFSFRQFASDIIYDITKIAIKYQLLNAMGLAGDTEDPLRALSKTIGGFMGFMDSGGDVPSGKFAIAGEKGPEIVHGPATVVGREDTAAMLDKASRSRQAAGNQKPVVKIRMVNAFDTSALGDYLMSSDGEQVLANWAGRNQAMFKNFTSGG